MHDSTRNITNETTPARRQSDLLSPSADSRQSTDNLAKQNVTISPAAKGLTVHSGETSLLLDLSRLRPVLPRAAAAVLLQSG